MPTECARIADQVRFAFSGDAWYGPNLRDTLTGVSAEQARARPVEKAHAIWELVLHIDLWADIAFRAAAFGIEMPKLYGTEKDWTTPFTGSEEEWAAAQAHLFETAERLAETIEAFPDERLGDIVPGREYNFYYLFHGVVQHSVYHAGQIALLKRG